MAHLQVQPLAGNPLAGADADAAGAAAAAAAGGDAPPPPVPIPVPPPPPAAQDLDAHAHAAAHGDQGPPADVPVVAAVGGALLSDAQIIASTVQRLLSTDGISQDTIRAFLDAVKGQGASAAAPAASSSGVSEQAKAQAQAEAHKAVSEATLRGIQVLVEAINSVFGRSSASTLALCGQPDHRQSLMFLAMDVTHVEVVPFAFPGTDPLRVVAHASQYKALLTVLYHHISMHLYQTAKKPLLHFSDLLKGDVGKSFVQRSLYKLASSLRDSCGITFKSNAPPGADLSLNKFATACLQAAGLCSNISFDMHSAMYAQHVNADPALADALSVLRKWYPFVNQALANFKFLARTAGVFASIGLDAADQQSLVREFCTILHQESVRTQANALNDTPQCNVFDPSGNQSVTSINRSLFEKLAQLAEIAARIASDSTPGHEPTLADDDDDDTEVNKKRPRAAATAAAAAAAAPSAAGAEVSKKLLTRNLKISQEADLQQKRESGVHATARFDLCPSCTDPKVECRFGKDCRRFHFCVACFKAGVDIKICVTRKHHAHPNH
jgi:hypothetical protein